MLSRYDVGLEDVHGNPIPQESKTVDEHPEWPTVKDSIYYKNLQENKTVEPEKKLEAPSLPNKYMFRVEPYNQRFVLITLCKHILFGYGKVIESKIALNNPDAIQKYMRALKEEHFPVYDTTYCGDYPPRKFL